jgi:hypothetical protein
VRKGNDLTTFTVPEVEKIRSLNLPDTQGPAQACIGKTLPINTHDASDRVTEYSINDLNFYTLYSLDVMGGK